MTLPILFPSDFVKALVGIALLILIDLVFGVAVALKLRKFDFKLLADFYRTTVMPNLLGWIVLDTVLRVAAFYQIPIVDALQPVLSIGFYGIVMVALLAQIVSKGALLAKPVEPPPAAAKLP
jgi:hypothetical protein